MHPDPHRRPTGGNVVPFAPRGVAASPRPSAASEAARRAAARRRADDVADSAHDGVGSAVTLALFVLFGLSDAALLLAAFGARLPW